MKSIKYEGGIPYTEEVPDLTPSQERAVQWLMDNAPCTCRGEVHDECRPCSECGDAPALNSDTNPEDDNVYCDECWEALVIEDERRLNEERAEEEEQSIDWIREDHEAMKFDQWWQRQKEEGWDNE